MSQRDAVPLQPVPPELAKLWDEALEAAGFALGEVKGLLFDGDPTTREPQWGMHLGPGDTTHDIEHCFTEAQRDEVDRLNLYKHRVIVWVGNPRLPPKIIQALMRHELRHAEQFANNEIVYRIGLMTTISLARVYAGKGDGAASIRRFTPHESDADAAASQLVAPIGDEAEARDGNFRSLVSNVQPPRPVATLARRILAFASLHPDAFSAEAQARVGSEQLLLEELDPDGPTLFRKLLDDEELATLREEIKSAMPTANEITDSGRTPARAWAAVHERLAQGLQRAEHLLGVDEG